MVYFEAELFGGRGLGVGGRGSGFGGRVLGGGGRGWGSGFGGRVLGVGGRVLGVGAAVNFGRRSGALTQWLEWVGRFLLLIHCMNHRLELAMKDSFKRID